MCRKCGTRLTPVEEGQEYHPLCYPQHEKLPGTAMSIYEMELKEDLLEMIIWGDRSSVRSQQVALGCSEAGDPCDRRIAMKMAGIKQVNFSDPLKANMGTAFHIWLDARMREFQEAHGTAEWITETEVWPARFLKGHVDLYSKSRFLVLDWKTTSADNLREWKKALPLRYLIQVMLYGKGMINLGYRVDRVGLIAINRAGNLPDVQALTVPYDETVAREALLRVWNIGKKMSQCEVDKHPEKFADFPAEPSRMCGYCPFYRGGSKAADGTGCPGKTTGDPVSDLFQ